MLICVSGGTGAGVKRPPKEKPQTWRHNCDDPRAPHPRTMPGYLTRCLDCGSRRPT